MNNCAILLNCVEDSSGYFVNLRRKYLKEDDFDHYVDLIKNGLGLLRLPVKLTEVFNDRENFLLELETDDPEKEYEQILAKYPDYLFVLETAFRKLGANLKKLSELRNKYHGDSPVYSKIFDAVAPRSDLKLSDKIDTFKKELVKFKLGPELFKMVHDSLIMAMTDFELEHIVEVTPIKQPSEIAARLPAPIRQHLSSVSKQRLLKMYKQELDHVASLQKEELKESELFLFRTHERLKGMIDELSRELKDTLFKMEKLSDQLDVIRQINKLTSKLQRMLLMQLYHFRDHESKRKESLDLIAQLDKIETEKQKADLLSLFEEIIFFRHAKKPPTRVLKRFAEYFISNVDMKIRNKKTKKIDFLRNYERKGMLGVSLDTELILENYLSFIRKVFIPVMINQLLAEIIVIWPYGDRSVDFGYFAGVNLEQGEEYPDSMRHYINSLKRTISVLTYDIRGSTYMGTRLRNAEKEWKIKYKFSQIMSGIAKRFGGYLLKDTGDGGVVWFGENSKETYDRSYIETITVKGVKIRQSIFSGGEFELRQSDDAGIRALQCGLEMIKAAEEFIKINFMHYRDWFGEVSQREVSVEGVTYALLPPEFRSLFRIGVGIASGQPARDIFFGVNSYGDPDFVGPLLSESHLYSMGRDPNRSVVIIDLATLIHIMLNAKKLSYFGLDEKSPVAIAEKVSELRKGIRDYYFNDYRFRAVRTGIHILEEADKRRALDFGYHGNVLVDDDGSLFSQSSTRINLLYEVIGE